MLKLGVGQVLAQELDEGGVQQILLPQGTGDQLPQPQQQRFVVAVDRSPRHRRQLPVPAQHVGHFVVVLLLGVDQQHQEETYRMAHDPVDPPALLLQQFSCDSNEKRQLLHVALVQRQSDALFVGGEEGQRF